MDFTDLPPDLVAGLGDMAGGGGGGQDMTLASYNPGTALIPSMKHNGALAAVAGAIIAAFGIEALPAVAVAIGYDAATLLKAWVGKKSHRRRRRGVTGRQLTNARRVIRVVEGMHRNLQHAFGRAAHHSTSHSGGHRRGKK